RCWTTQERDFSNFLTIGENSKTTELQGVKQMENPMAKII
ncbi:unnamed protein product, partial [Allacma fusca]